MTLSNSLLPSSTFVGFDRLLREADRMSKVSTNYPPYNIIRVSDEVIHIEFALAGFNKKDIDITVKENLLTISGSKSSTDSDSTEYIHKGISDRKFERVFRLHEHAQVTGADFRDGILTLAVVIVVPEEKKPKKIEIGGLSQEPQLLTED